MFDETLEEVLYADASLLGLELYGRRALRAADVKAAYRRRVRHVHPDVGGDEAEFDQLTAAYRRLRDAATTIEDAPAPRLTQDELFAAEFGPSAQVPPWARTHLRRTRPFWPIDDWPKLLAHLSSTEPRLHGDGEKLQVEFEKRAEALAFRGGPPLEALDRFVTARLDAVFSTVHVRAGRRQETLRLTAGVQPGDVVILPFAGTRSRRLARAAAGDVYVALLPYTVPACREVRGRSWSRWSHGA